MMFLNSFVFYALWWAHEKWSRWHRDGFGLEDFLTNVYMDEIPFFGYAGVNGYWTCLPTRSSNSMGWNIWSNSFQALSNRQQDCDPWEKRNTWSEPYRQLGFLCGNRYQVIDQAGGAPAEDGKHAWARRQRLEFWECWSSWNLQSRGPLKGKLCRKGARVLSWGFLLPSWRRAGL